jgi:TRAP-type transport system periplasmic protein
VLRTIGVAVLLGACVAGCGDAHGDRVGGTRHDRPRVLTLASASADAEDMAAYAEEVGRRSHGTLRVDVRNRWRRGEVGSEKGLVEDVTAGKADLGAASSRAWDRVGDDSFRALHVPLLIDSYALEARVVRSDLAGRMLRSLDPLGLAGIGILSGPLRRPLGVTRPLVAPADFRGLVIGVGQSRVASATMRALGARPVWFPIAGAINGFDGIEAHLTSITGNRYDRVGRYLATDVVLWPKPVVLFATKRVFDSLTPSQQEVLRQAAVAVGPAETARLQDDDLANLDILCRRADVSLASASDFDLAALRRAVQPVYDDLERDPGTRDAIGEIERMKRDEGASPETLTACGGATEPVSPVVSPVDGVYRMHSSIEVDSRSDPDPVAENYGEWTFVFTRGHFAITQDYRNACTWGYGTYAVHGDTFEWTFTDGGGIAPNNALNKPGEFFVFGWSLYRDALTVTPVKGQSSPENFRVRPWRRLSTTPTRRYFSRRCPPPAAALPR